MDRRCCLLVAPTVIYTTSCKHSLVLLRTGEIIARNMLSWLKLSIKLLLLHLVGCLYYCIRDARSHKHQFIRGKNPAKKVGGGNLTHLPKEEGRQDSGFWLAIQLYIQFYSTHSHFICFRTLRMIGTRWRSWLRHCATSRNVAGSIPDSHWNFSLT